MGIIIRQSVKTTLVNFIGVGIAAISTLFIYPLFPDIYGFAQFLVGTAALFVPFASIGLVSTIIKFFPKFQTSDHSNQGMLSMLLLGFIFLFGIFLIVFLGFRGPLLGVLRDIGVDSKSMLPTYLLVILIITAAIIFRDILIAYSTSNKRIVVPQIISQLGIKIFMPIAVLTFGFYGWAKMDFAYSLIAFFIVVGLLLVVYLRYLGVFKLGKPNWAFLQNHDRKEIFDYGIFSSFNQLGVGLAFRIDAVMIPMLLSFSSGGIYAMMLFLSNVIDIPARAVRSIAAPIISESWNGGDKEEISTIYKKSALNLVIPGIAILLLIWFSFDSIASISSDPSKLMAGKYVFLFLGIGKLFDLFTSVNDQIIVYSPKYKYNLIFILILGVINVVLNYYLIKKYGITGAAIASCIAYLIYNSIKLLFIQVSYKMNPFTPELFKVVIVGVLIAGLMYILPVINFSLIEIVKNAAVIGLIYFPVIYILNISPDFNKLCNIVINKIKSIV